ncbi:hypothetical protein CJF30_00007283 [Rutstroemia sp. NJR-2017a BBW]|nr:hypothetical protein CJF30_00007283 [Rutstroemia sp. NJR-2017a BBW]
MQVSRKQLAMLLKGQRVHIPDLSPIFQDWPQAINCDVDSIRPDTDKLLGSSVLSLMQMDQSLPG